MLVFDYTKRTLMAREKDEIGVERHLKDIRNDVFANYMENGTKNIHISSFTQGN